MLADIDEAQRAVRENDDDLKHIRKMIAATQNNIDVHKHTVDGLREGLTTLIKESKDFQENIFAPSAR